MRRVMAARRDACAPRPATAGRVDPDGACGVKIGLGAVEKGVGAVGVREYPCIRGGVGLGFAFYAEGCCRRLMFLVLT